MATLGTLSAAAAAATAWALPATGRFIAGGAPAEFWILAGLALVVDVPLYLVGKRSIFKVRSTLSVCFALAIFIIWGPAPAIVVQAAAAAACAIGQRFGRADVAVFTSRHVLALIAAGFVAVDLFAPERFVQPITGLAGRHLVPFTVLGAVWFATSLTLMQVAAAVISGHGPRRVVSAVREHLFVPAASILVIDPLLTTITGGWSVLISVPLFAWSILSSARMSKEGRIEREPVTGVLNRYGLNERIGMLTLYDYMKSGAVTRFAVAVVAWDKAPAVNRLLGREIHEGILTEAARRLVRVFGDAQVGVYIGERFVVIVPGVTDVDAEAVIEGAIRLTNGTIEINNIPFSMEPTVGVVLSPDHGRDLGTLLKKAELARDEAGRTGRLASLYVEATTTETSRRIAILSEARGALEDPARLEEIAVLYQPQIEVRTGRLAGVEALVRWTHPEWGAVSTDEFIEAIESSDVMHLLTRHVLGRTVAQVREWNDRGVPVRLAINASVQDFHNRHFIDEIEAALATHRVSPAQLTVEITERMAVSGDVLVARTADGIAGLGVGLSIDDFGTGFASLQQLRSLPVTEVKIDGSYVQAILSKHEDWAIVRSVYQLARALDLQVVAEGVEDQRIASALARLPGVVGQGWYFGRPMTAEVFQQWRHASAPPLPPPSPHDR